MQDSARASALCDGAKLRKDLLLQDMQYDQLQ